MPAAVKQINKSYTLLDLDTLDETDNGNSGSQVPSGASLAIAVDVTIFSGTTETLDLEVEWSPDGTNFGKDSDTFTQITVVGVFVKVFTVKAPIWRLLYTIGGTGVDLDFKVVVLGTG